MDPAALGTLIIGLDHARAEQSNEPRRQRRGQAHQATRRHPFRVAIATALRTLADRLEQPTTQAAHG
jgi:hypothetical protein